MIDEDLDEVAADMRKAHIKLKEKPDNMTEENWNRKEKQE